MRRGEVQLPWRAGRGADRTGGEDKQRTERIYFSRNLGQVSDFPLWETK
jgi:hypothetical protein